MPGLPRRHHYVTKAYLDGFTEPNAKQLFCYMRRKLEPFATTPVKLANIRDYHSFKRLDGSIDTSLETQIEREIETPGIPVLKNLALGKVNLDYQQRFAVARLVALQSVRVPYERSFMDRHNIENLRSYIREMDDASQRLGAPVNALDIAITPRDDRRLIKNWVRLTRAEILAEIKEAEEDPQRSSRETFFWLAESVSRTIARMEWTVRLASEKAHFVTSDRPVIRSFSDGPSSGRGLNDLRAELRFPLSKTSILEMKHRQWVVDAARKKTFKGRRKPKNADWTIGMEAADDAFIDSFNRQMAKQAHLLVFSGSVQEWLMEWMKEPIKPDKRVMSVLDTEEHLSVLGDNEPRLTRKRAWVVSSE